MCKALYTSVHLRIGRALAPELSDEEAHAAAAEDWLDDSCGASRIAFDDFARGIVQVVDLWTETVDELEYVVFTNKLYRRITRISGYRRLLHEAVDAVMTAGETVNASKYRTFRELDDIVPLSRCIAQKSAGKPGRASSANSMLGYDGSHGSRQGGSQGGNLSSSMSSLSLSSSTSSTTTASKPNNGLRRLPRGRCSRTKSTDALLQSLGSAAEGSACPLPPETAPPRTPPMSAAGTSPRALGLTAPPPLQIDDSESSDAASPFARRRQVRARRRVVTKQRQAARQPSRADGVGATSPCLVTPRSLLRRRRALWGAPPHPARPLHVNRPSPCQPAALRQSPRRRWQAPSSPRIPSPTFSSAPLDDDDDDDANGPPIRATPCAEWWDESVARMVHTIEARRRRRWQLRSASPAGEAAGEAPGGALLQAEALQAASTRRLPGLSSARSLPSLLERARRVAEGQYEK